MSTIETAADLNARLQTLGMRLRAHRKTACLTGEELARTVHISQPKISRIERGKVLPSPHDVEQIAIALELPTAEVDQLVGEANELAEHSRRWRTIHGRGLVGAQREALFTEQMAAHVRFFQPNLIPGLLQYRQYARDILERANITGQNDLDEAVRVRMERQDLLHAEDRTFEFIVMEGALRARYSTPAVMVVQLDLIRSLSKLPHVYIGIVPETVRLPHVVPHGFGMFDDTTVAIELLHGETVLNDAPALALYAQVFADFKAIAVSGPEADRLVALAQESMTAPPDDPPPDEE